MIDELKFWIKGIVLAITITIVLLIIVTMLLRFTSLRENKLPLINNLIMIISISIAGGYMAINIKEKGWLKGALIGLGYYFVLLILNIMFIKPVTFDLFTIWNFLIAVTTGAIGGMIGINIS